MAAWFARPVLHVTDTAASLAYYVSRLGFNEVWRHEEAGVPIVAQVERAGCALILASTWPDKAGHGSVFVSLDLGAQSKHAQANVLDALREEFATAGAEPRECHWGYRVLVVADPDGNELMFNYPN